MKTLEKNMMGVMGDGDGNDGTPQWGQSPFRPEDEYEAWDATSHQEL